MGSFSCAPTSNTAYRPALAPVAGNGIWRYMGPSGYVPLPPADSDTIESIYRSNPQGSFAASVKGTQYIVDFREMTLAARDTGAICKLTRDVTGAAASASSYEALPSRQASVPGDSTAYKWEYFSEGAFTPYDPAESDVLEQARLGSLSSISLSVRGNPYVIDFVNMKQIRSDNGFSMLIRRVPAAAAAAAPQYAVPAVAGPYLGPVGYPPAGQGGPSIIAYPNMDPGWQDSRAQSIQPYAAPLSASAGTKWIWEFQDDTGFRSYPPNVSQKLENAKWAGQTWVDFQVGSFDYTADLRTMTQINSYTSKRRTIRRVKSSASSSVPILGSASPAYGAFSAPPLPAGPQWGWENDRGTYTPYSPSDSQAIECARQAGSHFIYLNLQGFRYRIDINRLVQINERNHSERYIKRLPSSAPAVDTIATAPLPAYQNGDTQWRVEGDYGYTAYSPRANTKIENAFQSRAGPFSLITNYNLSYTIDFSTMTQTNDCSLRVRNICRGPPKAGAPGVNPTSFYPASPVVPSPAYNPRVGMDSGTSSLALSRGPGMAPAPAPASLPPPVQIPVLAPLRGPALALASAPLPTAAAVVATSAVSAAPAAVPAFSVVKLPAGNSEYGIVKTKFDESMAGKYTMLEVTKITNAKLKTKLRAKKSGMRSMRLFYGSARTKPSAIYDENSEGFGKHDTRNGKWGRALYFSVDARHVGEFAYAEGAMKQMLMVKVAVGTPCDYGPKEDGTLTQPPLNPRETTKRYDSVKGLEKGSEVYVIYNGQLAYPEYLISFK